jgi:hypothetical protein
MRKPEVMPHGHKIRRKGQRSLRETAFVLKCGRLEQTNSDASMNVVVYCKDSPSALDLALWRQRLAGGSAECA